MSLRPTEFYTTEIEIKKSRFIGIGYPIESVEDSREKLKKIRAEYENARHVCYGFLFGEKSTHMGMSDDGEPSGTAGRPILEVLKGSGYENILVAVVRYFGGTKLGTGGLVKAYTEITKLVVEAIKVEPYIERESVKVEIPYTLYNQVKQLIEKYEFPIDSEDFQTDIVIVFKLTISDRQSFEQDIKDLSNGKISLAKV